MPARNPEDLGNLFQEAILAGDLDAVIALYESGAAMPGRAIEVARRQADGTWLYVIDDPFTLGSASAGG
jgi:ketosteroid isomerase-like protein